MSDPHPQVTRMELGEYKRRVLIALRRELDRRVPSMGRRHTAQHISIKEVRLQTSPGSSEDELVVLFRSSDHTQHLFGYRVPALAPWNLRVEDPSGPEFYAEVVAVNLKELIEAAGMGLPDDRDLQDVSKGDSQGVTWFGWAFQRERLEHSEDVRTFATNTPGVEQGLRRAFAGRDTVRVNGQSEYQRGRVEASHPRQPAGRSGRQSLVGSHEHPQHLSGSCHQRS